MNTKNIITLSMVAGLSLPAMAQYDIIDSVAMKDQLVDVGATRQFTREQSAASVSVITNKDVNRRGGRNIGNNLLGQGNGLVSLQGAGLYNAANPTFYVRGLQSLNGSTPLILVDGIERSIDNVIAEDVESVQVLKDAAATAIYGYKGANGAVLITTKHGVANSKKIAFSYDHEFQLMANKPQFVNAATYAAAVNEAYHNQGSKSTYSDAVIDSYRNGTNPLYYPNVDWVGETFRDMAHMNRYNLEFSGGTKNIRYYTDVNLLTSYGFVKQTQPVDGDYSTQNKYTRASIRSNMDIDLTPTTVLRTHINGLLTEQSQPGSQADLWTMVYTVPANAFPIRVNDTTWGGNTVYTTSNPVAQSNGTAYYKNHQRSLNADFVLEQDLSSITDGLKASAQLGYDTWSNVYEDHSRTYTYGYYTVSNYTGGVVNAADATLTTDGSTSNMGTAANNNQFSRRFFVKGDLTYNRLFAEKHDLFAQLHYDYEFSDVTGVNTSVFRHNFDLLANYVYDNRYTAQLILNESASNRLASGSKWAFSPTAALSWNISNEEFMDGVEWIDFLKVRASAGLQQLDVLPGDNVWTYYNSFYVFGTPAYGFDNTGSGTDFGLTYVERAKTENLGREQALKYNFGVDAALIKGLNLSFDYYYQHRYDAWVSTAGSYTSVFGYTAPYENLGEVNSQGFEFAIDYSKQMGDWTFNLGGAFNFNKNEIVEQAEEPQLYDNTKKTGKPVNQIFGYQANGFFQKSDDLDGNGIISADEMKQKGYPVQNVTTIYPGDVKYQDLTGDGVIDSNDITAIGYSNVCPEINYNMHFGVEYQGIGIDVTLQGVANYSGVLSTNGMYRSAVATNTLSQYLYDNSWSSERGNTENPMFPRLSATSNANNDVTSTLNVFDRSYLKLRNIELYYRLPSDMLSSLKYVSAVRVYVKGIDLLTFDNLDNGDAAAYGVNQPLTRNIQLGASITF